jgi:hypothetical protein
MKHYCCFSEAIREGAKLTPLQAFHAFFQENATCAVGAAIHASYERPLTHADVTLSGLREFCWANPQFKYLTKTFVAPPCGCQGELEDGCIDGTSGRREKRAHLNNIIVHLNNHHHWTREKIADWLQGEEDKLGFVTLSVTEESQYTLNLKAVLAELGETLQEVSV